jgi:hypothetical protein
VFNLTHARPDWCAAGFANGLCAVRAGCPLAWGNLMGLIFALFSASLFVIGYPFVKSRCIAANVPSVQL